MQNLRGVSRRGPKEEAASWGEVKKFEVADGLSTGGTRDTDGDGMH